MSAPATTLHARRLRWRQVQRCLDASALRVALLASYTIDPMAPFLGGALFDAGLPASVTVGPFDQIVQACADDTGPVARDEPHLIVVAPRLPELAADDRSGRLRLVVDTALRAADRWGALLVAVRPALADIEPSDRGPARAVLDAFDEALADRAAVDVVTVDDIIAGLGIGHAYHPEMYAHAKVPYRDAVFAALADRIAAAVAVRLRGRDRAVLLDVDALPDLHGDVAETAGRLAAFRGHGGLVALRVRSDEPAAVPPSAVAALVDVWLPASGAVDAQVAELARRCGCAAEAVARDTIPTGPRPDLHRSRPVAAGTGGPLDLAGYVRSLHVRVACVPLAEDEVAPVAELARRNVDFCLGPAPAAAELAAARADPAQEVWTVRVSDRTGEFGVSGVVRLRASGASCVVDTMSLSCAVLGRGVETEVLSAVRAWAAERDCREVVARVRRTGRNAPAVDFLTSAATGPAYPQLPIRVAEEPTND